MRARALFTLVLGLALAVPAMAQDRTRAQYRLYAMGLHMADAEAVLASGAGSYRLELTYRTTGLVGFFNSGHQAAHAEGIWAGTLPRPRHYESRGIWRGADRAVRIDYDGSLPRIRELVPPGHTEHEPVPEALQSAAVDALSAAAELLRRVGRDSSCDAHGLIYDGRRASQVTVRTVRDEMLPRSDRSPFSGRALRCDFTGMVVAGFRLADAGSAARRPLTGSAWFARATENGPPIPVLLRFETRWFGPADMYLTGATDEPPVLAAADPAPVSPPATGVPRSRPSR